MINVNYNNQLTNRVVVRHPSDFGDIDSSKEYFLDGVIDMSGTPAIVIPSGGINIKGYDFNTSGLVNLNDNSTLFTSPVGGSGDIMLSNLFIEVSGNNSKVFDLQSDDGTDSIEIITVNYNNCTSLGELVNYRQGLETGTGRFGGSPSLMLSGTWSGGFVITTSIARSMDDLTTEPMFKAGINFSMQSRFRTNMNVDLGDLQPLLDFSDVNFPNPGSLQLQDMEVTRGGIFNPDDLNITPNITPKNLSSNWVNNNGLVNTHVGGDISLTAETLTTISSSGSYVFLEGTYSTSDLQHFDSPANGQLRHLGTTPRQFKVIAYVVIDGGPNDLISIRVRKFNLGSGITSTVTSQQANVNNFQGGADRCTFSILGKTNLDAGDYIFLEVANLTDTTNLTAQIGTFLTIEKRV